MTSGVDHSCRELRPMDGSNREVVGLDRVADREVVRGLHRILFGPEVVGAAVERGQITTDHRCGDQGDDERGAPQCERARGTSEHGWRPSRGIGTGPEGWGRWGKGEGSGRRAASNAKGYADLPVDGEVCFGPSVFFSVFLSLFMSRLESVVLVEEPLGGPP